MTNVWWLNYNLQSPISYVQETLGDVNQDGNIDIWDIMSTVNIVLNISPEPTEYETWAADINKDSQIKVHVYKQLMVVNPGNIFMLIIVP